MVSRCVALNFREEEPLWRFGVWRCWLSGLFNTGRFESWTVGSRESGLRVQKIGFDFD